MTDQWRMLKVQQATLQYEQDLWVTDVLSIRPLVKGQEIPFNGKTGSGSIWFFKLTHYRKTWKVIHVDDSAVLAEQPEDL